MILIYSNDIEFATTKTIEWINYYGSKYTRINNGDIVNNNHFSFLIGKNKRKLTVNNIEVNSYWYRRSKIPDVVINDANWNTSLTFSVKSHLRSELSALNNGLSACSKGKISLSNPLTAKSDKVSDLVEASIVGLTIPPTIITNDKFELLKFVKRHKDIIVKNIANAYPHYIDNGIYSTYTSKVDIDDIEKYPDKLFPALFQKRIEKKFEIRSFIIKNKIYSAAIFSQQNEETSIDFRKYSSSKPNRIVPFKLPPKVEKSLLRLMEKLRLDTGSIDLIRTENDFVFLEVNPVGQFGWISTPCNFHIEKRIAEYLIGYEEKS